MIQASIGHRWSRVTLGDEAVVPIHVPQIILLSRRAALAFISSLPITPPKVGKWDWTDAFLPRNTRRGNWQMEMIVAELDQKQESTWPLSDDGRADRNSGSKCPVRGRSIGIHCEV